MSAVREAGAPTRVKVGQAKGTADVPAKKTDFVAGTYELDPATAGPTTAVKITDMLGEEILVVLDGATTS